MGSFRFGVVLGARQSRHTSTFGSRAEFTQQVRRLEALGFDVLSMPDHLGSVAPFPALVAAADATTTMRLGTCVLNTAFYNPVLLTRDIAQANLLCDGRLEVGLGAGYVKEEFEAAGIPMPSGRARIDHLQDVTTTVKEQLPEVPLMIAGHGDRLLAMAARRADIVGLTGKPRKDRSKDPLADRVAVVRDAAGSRFAGLELNLFATGAPVDRSGRADLSLARRHSPELSDDKLAALPGVFHGSPVNIADTLRDYHDRYGISYFTVMHFHAEHFADAIAQLR